MATVGRKKGVTKTGGRAKGTPNKSTAEIKALAQPYGAQALETLFAIMRDSDNDTARIAAAKELLDRGYGKATQPMEHSGPGGGPLPVSINIIPVKVVGTDEQNPES